MYQKSYDNLNYQHKYLDSSSYGIFDLKKQAFSIIYIIFLLLVSISIILFISQTLKINQANYELLELERRLESIQAENQKLTLNLAQKTSLSQIERIAKNELNMVEAKNREYLVYNDQIEVEENFVADIPQEQFLLARIYDRIVARIMTVQAESID
ncbi:cell division protein FtsL [Halanaerobium sp. Z-7514]|uniref:Cell division protein FtsL n=1 Tax=Halanaerobium polyolivorans TaxID=2886943 RepID=A0AAW4WUQ4_9FIRM|nr:cell division protein FtsL [Halanaerobium polyolivorans]MCC3144741.1 cell division protein FtsL [Halanaerobium polyolivorans]RQD74457.1 MAG: septum formation inhibitor [Halanaerobium sp. MSAO_Bac5]